ncbi:MAG: VapE domain-containing protein [Nitrososphaera sp.]
MKPSSEGGNGNRRGSVNDDGVDYEIAGGTIKKRANLLGVVSWLTSDCSVKLNRLSNQIEISGKPAKDSDHVWLRLRFQEETKLSCGKNLMADAVEYVAATNGYDPLSDYFNDLKWDGTQRLEYIFIDALGAEKSEYTKEIAKRFLVSAVDRAMNPGCCHRLMLMLIGKEEVGKSLFCRDICPNSEWFTDYLPRDIHSVRAMESLQGKFIVESAELVSMRKSEQEAIKAFLSRSVDYVRLAYRRNPEGMVRRCVIIGTTNNELPIPNDAEWTRYWPVVCGQYERDWILENKDQLWGEAKSLLDSGYRWWDIDDRMKGIICNARDELREVDVWESVIETIGGEEITMRSVIELIGIKLEFVTRSVETRVGNLMSKHGWKRERIRRGEIREYIYRRSRDNI